VRNNTSITGKGEADRGRQGEAKDQTAYKTLEVGNFTRPKWNFR